MSALRPLVYYISAHGFGHGVRSCDILRAIRRIDPAWPIHIVSGLPAVFFANRLGGALGSQDRVRQAEFDVGLVQQDAVRGDLAATLEKLRSLCRDADRLIDAEAEFLQRQDAAAVVADIPGIPLAAAARTGIPAIAVGNFSWDWIYGDFIGQDADWGRAVEHFRECYAQADVLLRLPFACDTTAFERIEEVPLLATPGSDRRRELAERFGARHDQTWVLVALTSLGWREGALEKLRRLSGYEFFVVEPFDWPSAGFHAVSPAEFSFTDVLASVDVVISKPGFGIVSDCVVNGKPLVYADRGDFREYPVLVDAIERHLRQVHIPAERLYAGDWAEALSQVRFRPEPRERLAAGGAEFAARRILELGGR